MFVVRVVERLAHRRPSRGPTTVDEQVVHHLVSQAIGL